jgi:phage host-nuclease inhibitor protein Gam
MESMRLKFAYDDLQTQLKAKVSRLETVMNAKVSRLERAMNAKEQKHIKEIKKLKREIKRSRAQSEKQAVEITYMCRYIKGLLQASSNCK